MDDRERRRVAEAVRDMVRKLDITPHLGDEPSLEELREQAALTAGFTAYAELGKS
jgi:hypothetical protein